MEENELDIKKYFDSVNMSLREVSEMITNLDHSITLTVAAIKTIRERLDTIEDDIVKMKQSHYQTSHISDLL